ncbi:hypothetical protein ABN034_24620 [Actinopolymorpha sp. B11F2]|uniref:hypothetical protein n=1 Tax=Actinopolymorpha sp. B11F2 TaxID=3160862 RepID=UPI0032E3AC2F
MARQAAAGLRVVNDGEASKIGYSTYVKERLDGFGGKGPIPAPPPDAHDLPEYWADSNPGLPRRLADVMKEEGRRW